MGALASTRRASSWRPGLADSALALALLVAATFELALSDSPDPLWVPFAAVLAATLPLAWRERTPLSVVLAAVGGVAVAGAFGTIDELPLLLWLSVGAGLYSLGEHGTNRQVVIGVVLTTALYTTLGVLDGDAGGATAGGLLADCGRRHRTGRAHHGRRVGRARGAHRAAPGGAGAARPRGCDRRARADRPRAARRDRPLDQRDGRAGGRGPARAAGGAGRGARDAALGRAHGPRRRHGDAAAARPAALGGRRAVALAAHADVRPAAHRRDAPRRARDRARGRGRPRGRSAGPRARRVPDRPGGAHERAEARARRRVCGCRYGARRGNSRWT